jgi:hypothetical protein
VSEQVEEHRPQNPWDYLVGRLAAIEELLMALIDQGGGGGGQPLVVLVAVANDQHIVQTGDSPMASVDILDSQLVSLAVAEVDAAGNPVSSPSPDAWSSSDATVVAVAADPSDPTGLGAVATAVGPLGTATVTCAVTVTNPDGTTATVSGSLDVNVLAGPVSAVTITPGAPSAKP